MAVSGGFGVNWKVDVSSVLTTVPNVRDIAFPEEDNEITDITAHDSTNGYTERIPTGRVNTNEFTVTLTWDDAETTHQEIRTHHASKALLPMSITSPDGQETLSFSAYVRKLARSSAQNGSYDMVVTLAPTGAVTTT